MWKHVASNALTLFVLALIGLAGVIGWGQRQYVSDGPLEQAICVQVPSGTNMRRMSVDLAERGAISNETIFRLGADYSGKADLLKAGSYLVAEKAPMSEIVDILTRGGASTCGTEIVLRVGVTRSSVDVRELDPTTNRFVEKVSFALGDEPPAEYLAAKELADTRLNIVVAEGATSWQIMQSLTASGFLANDTDSLPAEGSLAPDGYEITEGMKLSELLADMAREQEERLATAWRGREDGLPLETMEEALVLASIVEKETGRADERRQVASVFVNRLNRGMRLQTDPTVIYGITEGKAPLGRGLRQSELRRETPYNTYVISGLPPTPIANPGLASIEAVMNPAKTDFLFFVADTTGGHAFSETLSEHNANVAKLRAAEAAAANE